MQENEISNELDLIEQEVIDELEKANEKEEDHTNRCFDMDMPTTQDTIH